MASQYTELLSFLADVIKITYNDKERRPNKLNVFNTELIYNLEKSCCMFSHYETEDFILVGVKGVSNLFTLFIGFGQGLRRDKPTKYVERFCKKYEDLLREDKQVFLIGHSLGAYAITSCSMKYSKKIKSFLFAPYVPEMFGKVWNEYQKPHLKKIFYRNDPIANKLYLRPSNLKNALIFKPKSMFMNTHKISTFQQSPSVLNQDFYKYYN